MDSLGGLEELTRGRGGRFGSPTMWDSAGRGSRRVDGRDQVRNTPYCALYLGTDLGQQRWNAAGQERENDRTLTSGEKWKGQSS